MHETASTFYNERITDHLSARARQIYISAFDISWTYLTGEVGLRAIRAHRIAWDKLKQAYCRKTTRGMEEG
jgi:cation transport regulator ChaB